MLFRGRRRRKLLETPWPTAWRQLAQRRVPLYSRLPAEDQERLEGAVQVFLAEKTYEGCGGQPIDDEVRIVIASQACLLLQAPGGSEYFPELDSILVYPQSFRVERDYYHDDGLVTQAQEEYLGESWGHGALVLSWQDVREDTTHPERGYNVVIHEFAHQLDEETGEADGIPLLDDARLVADWGRVCRAEYEQLCVQVERDQETFLDPYAAEDPAEFFAVISETFFTISSDLQAEHPDLYDLLGRYYGFDPASWTS